MASGKQWKEKVSNAAYTPSVFIWQTQINKKSMENMTMEKTWWNAQRHTIFEISHNTIFTEQYL